MVGAQLARDGAGQVVEGGAAVQADHHGAGAVHHQGCRIAVDRARGDGESGISPLGESHHGGRVDVPGVAASGLQADVHRGHGVAAGPAVMEQHPHGVGRGRQCRGGDDDAAGVAVAAAAGAVGGAV